MINIDKKKGVESDSPVCIPHYDTDIYIRAYIQAQFSNLHHKIFIEIPNNEAKITNITKFLKLSNILGRLSFVFTVQRKQH